MPNESTSETDNMSLRRAVSIGVGADQPSGVATSYWSFAIVVVAAAATVDVVAEDVVAPLPSAEQEMHTVDP